MPPLTATSLRPVQGSPLVAACGAPLCVAVCNAADGTPVTPAELPSGAQLEVRPGGGVGHGGNRQPAWMARLPAACPAAPANLPAMLEASFGMPQSIAAIRIEARKVTPV